MSQLIFFNNPGWFMVLNNISVISWRSVLLVKEIGASGENHRPAALTTLVV